MRALSLLIKPASGNCNMRCKYCFYADVTDNRSLKNHGIMTFGTLETIVNNALSETTDFCMFGFQGGEPTLAGLSFFDNLRLDAMGKGTHTRCIQAARLLARHKVDFNILSVVTHHLASHPDKAYRFYKQNNFRYIQFIPCLDEMGKERGANSYSLDAKTYGKFLCRVFDLWYEDYQKGDYYSIRAFDNYIHMLAGHPPENCAMGGICRAYALIEADGSVYPCDFYAVDQFLMGNVDTHGFEEILQGEIAKNFIAPSQLTDPLCLDCEIHFICRGGCRRDREPIPGYNLSLNYYCESYKDFFQHALPRMRTIAR